MPNICCKIKVLPGLRSSIDADIEVSAEIGPKTEIGKRIPDLKAGPNATLNWISFICTKIP